MNDSRLIVAPDAELDLVAAHDWYQKQASLGEEFMAAIDDILDHIVEFPLSRAPVERGIRRALVKRFPYTVYYKVTDNFVHVLAVWHGRRDRESLLASRLET